MGLNTRQIINIIPVEKLEFQLRVKTAYKLVEENNRKFTKIAKAFQENKLKDNNSIIEIEKRMKKVGRDLDKMLEQVEENNKFLPKHQQK